MIIQFEIDIDYASAHLAYDICQGISQAIWDAYREADQEAQWQRYLHGKEQLHFEFDDDIDF